MPPPSKSTYRPRCLRSAACRRSRASPGADTASSRTARRRNRRSDLRARTASYPHRHAGCGWRSGSTRPSSRRGHRQGTIPRLHLALLRADVERDAARLQAQTLGEVEHLDRHLRIAAELARQRPFGACAVIENAAEHFCAGGGTGDLLDFRGAIDREQANAEREGARDITLLLDRVAIGNPLRGCTGGQRHLDLGDRGAVEARAYRGQQRQHFRRRVCLHRVEHAAVRQRLREGLVVVTHDLEVDDETWLDVLALVTTVAQEFLNTFGHSSTLPNGPATGPVQK